MWDRLTWSLIVVSKSDLWQLRFDSMNRKKVCCVPVIGPRGIPHHKHPGQHQRIVGILMHPVPIFSTMRLSFNDSYVRIFCTQAKISGPNHFADSSSFDASTKLVDGFTSSCAVFINWSAVSSKVGTTFFYLCLSQFFISKCRLNLYSFSKRPSGPITNTVFRRDIFVLCVRPWGTGIMIFSAAWCRLVIWLLQSKLLDAFACMSPFLFHSSAETR